MIEFLPWDSRLLGVSVARLNDPNIDDAQLMRCAEQAERQGVALLYWFAPPERPLPADVRFVFGGHRIDCRHTYRFDAWDRLEKLSNEVHQVSIGAWRGRLPSRRLLDLAVVAGRHSRFNVDAAFPTAQFESMFRIWIQNSLRGESDRVFVAETNDSAFRQPAGFVSVRVCERQGQISLIAVADAVTRLGIGKALTVRALAAAREGGSKSVSVVTQQHNEAACRLYERCGFELESRADVYHFWLKGLRSSRRVAAFAGNRTAPAGFAGLRPARSIW